MPDEQAAQAPERIVLAQTGLHIRRVKLVFALNGTGSDGVLHHYFYDECKTVEQISDTVLPDDVRFEWVPVSPKAALEVNTQHEHGSLTDGGAAYGASALTIGLLLGELYAVVIVQLCVIVLGVKAILSALLKKGNV